MDQLHKVNVKIDKEDKALLFIHSLPDSYDNLVTTLLFEKDTISLDDITTSIISNEIRRRLNLEEGQEFGLIGRIKNCK